MRMSPKWLAVTDLVTRGYLNKARKMGMGGWKVSSKIPNLLFLTL